MNIADAIETHARARPGAPAVLRGDWTLTYAHADAAVNRIAADLAAQGVLPGHFVGTLLPTSPLHLLIILAIARLGAVLVVIHPNENRPRLRAIIERFRLSAVISEHADARIPECRWIRPGRAWMNVDGAAPAAYPSYRASVDHLWLIAMTSGTTGRPKGVARTHADFLEISALHREYMKIGPESRFLCRMGIQTGAILPRILHHLHAGGAIVFPGNELPAALDEIDRHHVTHGFVTPTMIGSWLKVLPSQHRPFRTLTHLLVGGGSMPETLMRQAAERITPNWLVSYGTTETWFAALADSETLNRHPGTAGRLLPWIEAQAVDESDRPLPAGETGVLRFRGAGVATEYYGVAEDPTAMAKAFRNGWCYVGDIGHVTADRLLYVAGRADDIVNVGGPKINAIAVEKILLAHPDVVETAAVGITSPDGRRWLAAVVVTRGVFDGERLRQHYVAQGGQHSSLIRFVPAQQLPRNAMGKVVKHELIKGIKRRISAPVARPPAGNGEASQA